MLTEQKAVIVIEDNLLVLNTIRDILELEGYTVTASVNSEPLQLLYEINPDLIILDHYLGNAFGHTICKELKEDPDTCNIPVILISGADNLEELAADCKADAFISKPFSTEEILSLVKAYCTEINSKNFPAI